MPEKAASMEESSGRKAPGGFSRYETVCGEAAFGSKATFLNSPVVLE
ncbi:MAG: hypothetical protein QF645_02695 [Planctomycetota bacterium]|nr:hypothetical protein [Planctomycetota bacterium]